MSRLPDFVIIGFPKSGTHALLRTLGTHPEIYTHPDEIGYFGRDRMTLDEYRRLFAVNKPIAGEKTATYVYSAAAMEHMARTAPELKILVCLRHPVHMLHSFFDFRVFEHQEGWPPGFDGEEHPFHRVILDGETINAFGLTAADYVRHLEENVLPRFDPAAVEYVIQERMWARPQESLDRIQAFLGATRQAMEVPVINSRVQGADAYPNIDYGHPDYPRALATMIEFFNERRSALLDVIGMEIPEWDRYDRLYAGLLDG